MTTTTTTHNYKVTAEFPVDDSGQQDMTGYRTVVRDGADIVYDSQKSYDKRGIFPAEATALRHGERWIAAQAELEETIARVKRERNDALPIRLGHSHRHEASLVEQRKDINASIKFEQKRREKWAEDALNPQVSLAFPPPGAEDFVITIKPSSIEEDQAEDATDDEPERDASEGATADGEGEPAGDEQAPEAKPNSIEDDQAELPNIHDLVRPAGLQVGDELVYAIGRIKGDLLRARVSDLLAVDPDPLSPSTVAALLWAEGVRASTKPRTTLLGYLEKHGGGDLEVTDADRWAALLLCHSVGAPRIEWIEAGVPVIVDLAVVRHVQAVELARGKHKREAVIDLCEQRLGELCDRKDGAA